MVVVKVVKLEREGCRVSKSPYQFPEPIRAIFSMVRKVVVVVVVKDDKLVV